MNKIWRVENKQGKGPYQKLFNPIAGWLLNRHDEDMDDHPTPHFDEGIKRGLNNGEICGFISLEQAKEWFSNYELDKLKGAGFELKEIEVSKITAIGKKQILVIK